MLCLAICEDDPMFLDFERQVIEQHMQEVNIACRIDTYASSLEMKEALEAGIAYEILFLDIDMPELDGISLGVLAKRKLPASLRIYISSKTDLVFASFAAQPFAFIPKEQLNEQIETVIERCLREIRELHQVIVIDTGRSRLQTDVDSLHYAEALGRKVFLHINDTSVESATQLKVLADRLLPLGFLRIHKSFLVNYRSIFSINKDSVILKNGQELPLSKHRAHAIRSQYLMLTSE